MKLNEAVDILKHMRSKGYGTYDKVCAIDYYMKKNYIGDLLNKQDVMSILEWFYEYIKERESDGSEQTMG